MKLPNPKYFLPAVFIYAIIFLSVLAYFAYPDEPVNMEAIKKIESSGNALAYNRSSGARGHYQITPVCLEEWNNYHPQETYTEKDLFNPEINRRIAEWYMNVRIGQMLRHYKKKETIENKLTAYNCGISCVVNNRLPKETKDYIRKYKELTDGLSR